jgi:hypothetical protein
MTHFDLKHGFNMVWLLLILAMLAIFLFVLSLSMTEVFY